MQPRANKHNQQSGVFRFWTPIRRHYSSGGPAKVTILAGADSNMPPTWLPLLPSRHRVAMASSPQDRFERGGCPPALPRRLLGPTPLRHWMALNRSVGGEGAVCLKGERFIGNMHPSQTLIRGVFSESVESVSTFHFPIQTAGTSGPIKVYCPGLNGPRGSRVLHRAGEERVYVVAVLIPLLTITTWVGKSAHLPTGLFCP